MKLSLATWCLALLDKRNAFGVSLYGFAGRLRINPPWEPMHQLNGNLFYYVAEGSFESRSQGICQTVTAGDLVWAGHGTQLHFTLPENESLLLWRFRLEALDAQSKPLRTPAPFLHLRDAQRCEPWMLKIVDEAQHGTLEPYRLRGLLLCLFTEIERATDNRHNEPGLLSLRQREVLMKYLAVHLRGRPTPEQLANLLEISPDYFTRCFRRTYGIAPRRWIMEERIRMAAMRLLESNLSVSQIAREFGYEDIFLFSRQFKQVTGASPAKYRATHSGIIPL